MKLGKKRHYDMEKLEEIINKLVNGEVLEARYADHHLQGQYSYARDCHITPDWILIYAIVGDELRLIRTGTHSDLYKQFVGRAKKATVILKTLKNLFNLAFFWLNNSPIW